MGPFGCIGKNLEMTELRTLTTRIVLKFDMELAPGEDGKRIMYETKDHFTGQVSNIFACFDIEFVLTIMIWQLILVNWISCSKKFDNRIKNLQILCRCLSKFILNGPKP